MGFNREGRIFLNLAHYTSKRRWKFMLSSKVLTCISHRPTSAAWYGMYWMVCKYESSLAMCSYNPIGTISSHTRWPTSKHLSMMNTTSCWSRRWLFTSLSHCTRCNMSPNIWNAQLHPRDKHQAYYLVYFLNVSFIPPTYICMRDQTTDELQHHPPVWLGASEHQHYLSIRAHRHLRPGMRMQIE